MAHVDGSIDFPDMAAKNPQLPKQPPNKVQSDDLSCEAAANTGNILNLFKPLAVELCRFVDGPLPEEERRDQKLWTSLDDASEWIRSIREFIEMLERKSTIENAGSSDTYDYDLERIDQVCKLLASLGLLTSSPKLERTPNRHTSICLALGDFAERLAGERSISLLTPEVLDYLVGHLRADNSADTVYFAVSALERFAQTKENKVRIIERLKATDTLKQLESWGKEENELKKRQVGFMVQWDLDNVFVTEDRVFSHQTTSTEGINAMLDQLETTGHLKISSDGLEARNDQRGCFESAKCTFAVTTGIWYYEVLLVSEGLMQIGWAARKAKFQEHDGQGVGDDEYSMGYDGDRNLIWYNRATKATPTESWKAGDVLGCLLDMDNLEVGFYLNGTAVTVDESQQLEFFKHRSGGFLPAASFSFRQHCRFNFGHKPFRFPPADKHFQIINDVATLTPEQRTILPLAKKRHLLFMRQESVSSTVTCFVCSERAAQVLLEPCQHDGYCCDCALKLEECALCRATIMQRILQQPLKL